MTGLKILAGVVLVLLLLGQIRLGGEAEYASVGLFVKLRIGWIRLQVFPLKRKKKEKAPQKKNSPVHKAEKPTEEPAPKKGGSLELIKRMLPLACEAAGELKRKIRIDRLYLYLTVASSDAAGTAMAYGYANMTLGMLWPLIEQNFEVKDPRVQTGVDFTAKSPSVYLSAAFSARLGQMVSFCLRFGWKALRIYFQSKREHKNAERGDLT